jgi:hypothetical protein
MWRIYQAKPGAAEEGRRKIAAGPLVPVRNDLIIFMGKVKEFRPAQGEFPMFARWERPDRRGVYR